MAAPSGMPVTPVEGVSYHSGDSINAGQVEFLLPMVLT